MRGVNLRPDLPIRLNRRPFYTFQLSSTKTSQSYQLPNDILALAQLEVLLYGFLTATYGSGTPVAKYGSVLHSLVETINVMRGSDAFKSASPETLGYENALLNKNFNVIRSSAGATGTNDPQADVTTVPHGTTGQVMSFREQLTIHFAYPHAHTKEEYFNTCFRTTNIPTATVQIIQKPYLNIRDDKNTAPVVYSADALYLQFNIVEYVGLGAEALNLENDYRQEEMTASYTAKTKDIQKLPRYGALSSIIMTARDGASGSATTATSKLLNDNLITTVKLVKNQEIIVDSNWKDLKDQTKSLFGVQFPKVAGVARDDGMAGIFFTKNGFRDLVDITQESASVANLVLETNDNSNVTYTEGAFLRILVSQIARIKR